MKFRATAWVLIGAWTVTTAQGAHWQMVSLDISNYAHTNSYDSTSETILNKIGSLLYSPVNLPYYGLRDSFAASFKRHGGHIYDDESGAYTDWWTWKFKWVADLPGDQPPSGGLSAYGYNAVYINSSGIVSSMISNPLISGAGDISFGVLPTTTAPQCILNFSDPGYNDVKGALSWAGGTPQNPTFNFQYNSFGGISNVVNNSGEYDITFVGNYAVTCGDSFNFNGPDFMNCISSSDITYAWTISSIGTLNVTYP